MQRYSRSDLEAAKRFFEHINTIEPYSIAWFFSAETNQEKLKKFCAIAKDCIGDNICLNKRATINIDLELFHTLAIIQCAEGLADIEDTILYLTQNYDE